jgi:hypothetical protein
LLFNQGVTCSRNIGNVTVPFSSSTAWDGAWNELLELAVLRQQLSALDRRHNHECGGRGAKRARPILASMFRIHLSVRRSIGSVEHDLPVNGPRRIYKR